QEEEVEALSVPPAGVRQNPQPVRACHDLAVGCDGLHRDRSAVALACPRSQHLVRAGEVQLLDAVPDADPDPKVAHSRSMQARRPVPERESRPSITVGALLAAFGSLLGTKSRAAGSGGGEAPPAASACSYRCGMSFAVPASAYDRLMGAYSSRLAPL